MRNLRIVLAMITCMALAGPALAQSNTGMRKDMGKAQMMKKEDKVMKTMFQGMNKEQKMTAANYLKHLSKAEHDAMIKRCSLCMKDPHKGMTKDMKVTDRMVHDHMMAGMSRPDQKALDSMMKKMSTKEKAVCMKMVENCCWYGFKHAK